MADDEVSFEVSWDESHRLRPILKDQSEAIEIAGAPAGKWWLKKMTTELTPKKGIVVTVYATKSDE